MAEKRKDNRGRILRTGESQRKDGRYQFQYTDVTGKRHCVYDMNLADLREREKVILKDLEDGIRCGDSKKITLNNLFEMYLESHRKIRDITKLTYTKYWKKHIKDSFIGEKTISSIRHSDMIRLYNSLLDKGLSTGAVGIINAVLHPAFEMAVDDDLIRKNPCKGVMTKIEKTEPNKKKAMTIEQQRRFIGFLAEDEQYSLYHPLFAVLLGTGMRIGECTGLTWKEVDLKKGLIYVTHTIRYDNYGDGSRFHVTEPKTESGKRVIPMIEDVRKAFLTIRERNLITGGSGDYAIGAYKDFIFLTSNKRPYTANNVDMLLNRIVKAYNKKEENLSESEKQEPVFLPHLSPHVMRHTFCTRFCENETNVKVIQEIMGHSDINVTMNVYNHVTIDKAKECMHNLEGKIKMS